MGRAGPPARGGGRLFAAIVTLSGFCGVSYEVLYGRLLSELIGSTFAVNAAVLLSFLLGMGAGCLAAHRLWRYLPLVEAGIGVYALVFVAALPLVERLLYAGGGAAGEMVAALSWAAALVGAPAFLTGVSLPLMTAYLGRLRGREAFSGGYALYNLGAAAVVLLIEYVFIRAMGVRATVFLVALCNLLSAMAVFSLYGGPRSSPPTAVPAAAVLPLRLYAALVLAGVASAVFQLLMTRVAECLLGPFRETFALVLCMVLAGIALGAWACARLRLSFPSLMVGAAAGVAGLLGGFTSLAGWYAGLRGGDFPLFAVKTGLVAVMMGLPAVAFGGAVPALLRRERQPGRDAGRLLAVSCAANAAGFLVMALVLHPLLDYGAILMWVLGLSVAACLLSCADSRLPAAAAIVLLAAGGWLWQHQWREGILYLGHTAFHGRRQMERALARRSRAEVFKGAQDVFSIVESGGSPRFFINGYVSMALDSPAEPLVGGIAAAFAPRHDRALVLGVGSGNTASVVGLLFEQTDGVEINAAVLANLHRMKTYNLDIEHNPRVRLVHDDAIHFVRAGASRYSLVVNTVTTPLYFSSAKLYTLDFLEDVKRRLTPDGVYVTWVDSRVGDEGIDIMLHTLGRAFRHTAIAYVKASYFLLLCSDEEIRAGRTGGVARQPLLARRFRRLFQIEPRWLPYVLLHPDAVGLAGRQQGEINRLDRPVLEFAMARLRRRGYDGFKRRLRAAMRPERVGPLLAGPLEFDPLRLPVAAAMILGDSSLTDRWKEVVLAAPGDTARFHSLLGAKLIEFARASGTADAFHRAGFTLMEQGAYKRAVAAFLQALALNPRRDNSNFNIGACYEYLGMYDEAARYYRRERDVDPDDDDVPYRIGRVLLKQGKFAAARAVLEEAVASRPTVRELVCLGRALEGMGMGDAARRAYDNALGLDPDSRLARAGLRRLAPAATFPGHE